MYSLCNSYCFYELRNLYESYGLCNSYDLICMNHTDHVICMNYMDYVIYKNKKHLRIFLKFYGHARSPTCLVIVKPRLELSLFIMCCRWYSIPPQYYYLE